MNVGENDGVEYLRRHLGIEVKIGGGLGKMRWVVDWTISWPRGTRRMRIRYNHLNMVQKVWNTLAASMIYFGIWHRGFPLVG
jgi:hypothetical protein